MPVQEGSKKVDGGKKSFRLQCSFRNISAEPMADSGAKVITLRRSASHRDGTASVLLLCSFLGWDQLWEASPSYKCGGGSRRAAADAVS